MNRYQEECITLALAGNPNSGKTSIFNNLTGAKQHVGNWPGVTVEKKEGTFSRDGHNFRVVDLPGTYSLTAYSMDEVIARDFIMSEKPDVVVSILDASNLERNLYLAVQILELNANIVIALNMIDTAETMGIKIDAQYLSELLGVPVVATVASRNNGMDRLVATVLDTTRGVRDKKRIQVYYGKETEKEIERLVGKIENNAELKERYVPRWLAIKLIENDSNIIENVRAAKNGNDIADDAEFARGNIRSTLGEDPEIVIADMRYGFISGLCREVVSRTNIDRRTASDRADAVLANRVLGFPIFLGLMWLTFQLTFTIGTPPMEWLGALFNWMSVILSQALGDTLLSSLIVDGVIGGVGGVVSFLPNILLLFLGISLLEDSGYMARAAFIMDRIMHRIGLHGKSFIPMVIGFGCNVPAIMATRTLDNPKDRLITILITPLMSCGARLPVYILLTGAFFSPAVSGHIIFSLYLIGILMAVIMAKVFRRFLFQGELTPFVMELPPYRIPTLKSVLLHIWERAWMYVKKAGTIILAISVIVWFLMTFPRNFDGKNELQVKIESTHAQIAAMTGNSETPAASPEFTELQTRLEQLEGRMARESLEKSFAGKIGSFIEPAFRPIGFDLKATISIIPAFLAKELVVSTLGTVYSIGDADAKSKTLRERIRKDPNFNPLTAYVLMLFTLLTVPCVATIGIIKKETNSWIWPAFSVAYQSTLAWTVCFIVYQTGRLLGIGI